jgi:hypothetical protein
VAPPTASTRQQRRAAQRTAPPRAAVFSWRPLVSVSHVLWGVATAFLLAATMIVIERKITWYLAVDQFGYLTFAHDLLHGRIFHHWPPLDALLPKLPPRVDVLVQTYVYDHGKLYCRYAPGFAMILAGWLGLFGDDGAHYLNATIYLLLLVLVLAFAARIFRSRWRATAAVALVILCPTFLYLWALTLVRDLAAHVSALLALFLLLPARGRRLAPRRAAAAGLALGWAATIRPDAIIYAVPALSLAAARWWREKAAWPAIGRMLAAGALGLAVGLAPFLTYNWLSTGHPLRPTQGMELQEILPAAAPPAAPSPKVGYPPGAWRGGTAQAVQGGGLRLANIRRTLPGNLELVRYSYGVLVGLAVWGAMVALVQRRLLFLATVPYIVPALLFFSMWSRPDGRYLVGLWIFVPLLIVEGALGTLDLVRRLSRLGRGAWARGIAIAFAAACTVAVGLSAPVQKTTALPVLAILVPVVAASGTLAVLVWTRRRIAGLAAPLLGLALAVHGGWLALSAPRGRASFQRPQMLRAREAFAKVVQPGAVVMTTEEVGRPAENIGYYSGVAHALYFTDLLRWQLSVPQAAELLARGGMKPYLLIPTVQPDRAQVIAQLQQRFAVDLVADIPPTRAMDYFVAAPFHRGIHMELWRLDLLDGAKPLP